MRTRVNIRQQPHYRREAFIEGLRAAGHTPDAVINSEINSNDLLVIWNRYGANDSLATQYEKKGGKVLVVENGYYGQDTENRQYYSIALNHHNGSGIHHVGEANRWSIHNTILKPWRTSGTYILVCPSRGIGEPKIAMPRTWTDDVVNRLKHITNRPIRIRAHPGNWQNKLPEKLLGEDLKDAWAVVVWSSNCATEALIEGIPVFYEAPNIITELACNSDITQIDTPERSDRLPAMNCMAWSQWSVDEIYSGKPFKVLI